MRRGLRQWFTRHDFHGEWNYTVSPKTADPEGQSPDDALAIDPGDELFIVTGAGHGFRA
jgi:hypothetical protein